MNWKAILFGALALVPAAIQASEKLVVEARAGVEKKALAMDSISSITGLADSALTGTDKLMADAITALVSTAIDVAVTIGNASGKLTSSSSPALPEPVAAAA
jgi:hypothetical protein